jgi:sulfite reductase (NADPH) hemoprotein beta-component
MEHSNLADATDVMRSGRTRLSFASTADIDEFVATLEKYEHGELTPMQWRAFRLVRGVYGQRQDDVQMFRVKVPQGVISADGLRALADCCETWSRGFAHITTRQNIQMHFVKLSDTEACMRRLAEVGITTREACGNSVRNIVACPFAGVCSGEAFDVTPYAEATTRYFLRHRLSSSLPRKFKMSFGGCEPDCAGGAFHDIGFRARVRGANGIAERGFHITVGGGTAILCQSGWLLHEFVPAGQIFDVAEAVLRVFHKHGSRQSKANARMKYLIRKIGWAAWKKLYDDELARVRAEGGAQLPWDDAPVEPAPPWRRPEPPAVSEVATRAAAARLKGPGILPDAVPPLAAKPSAEDFVRFTRTNVRAQPQEGYVTLTVRVPMGDLTGPQFRVLADLSLAYSDGTVRTTQNQNLVLRWVRREDLPELYKRLCAIGLGRADADTIADITSCPGAESCNLAVTQSRGLGRELSLTLEARPDLAAIAPEASIKISGCPNGCGQHHISTIGFQGGLRRMGNAVLPLYQLLIGGGVEEGGASFGKRSVKIPARRVAQALERLLVWYKENRADGEDARAFFGRADLKQVESLLADLCEITPDDARPEDFIDIGEDHSFTGETKEGECAA